MIFLRNFQEKIHEQMFLKAISLKRSKSLKSETVQKIHDRKIAYVGKIHRIESSVDTMRNLDRMVSSTW